jgi:peptidyl-prolyl cis-trans isomerase A (cyclophilin A)
MIALLLLSTLGCGEDPAPPKRTVAPEPPAIAKKPTPPVKVDAKPQEPAVKPPPPPTDPKPPPPPLPADEKPIPKVLLDPSLPDWLGAAPPVFKVKLVTTKGDITIQVTREWAPRGADRFYGLVKNGYYDDTAFFRVIGGFMAQVGIHGRPEVNAVWRNQKIQDDPVTQSNTRGMVTYAKGGPNSRTTQIFINYADRNSSLDGQIFSPFGKVIEGMEVADSLFNGYGGGPPTGPRQDRIQNEGNAYLRADFKDLDYIKTARIIP